MMLEHEPSEFAYDLSTAMLNDTTSDMTITSVIGSLSATLRNAKVIDASPPEMSGGGMFVNSVSTFRGYATDTSTPELALALA